MVYVSVCTSLFSFPDDNLSKYQWISIKLGMCIDIVEIWIGIADQQISSLFLQLSACLYTIVVGYYHFMFYYMFWVIPWHIPHLSFCSFVNMWADLRSITFKCNQLQLQLLLNFKITDYNYNYFWSECNQLQLQLLYKSNHDYFMITYDYFPSVTLFSVGEYITLHLSSLHNLQRNEYDWKEICNNKWFNFCNIHSSNCHTNCQTNKYSFSAKWLILIIMFMPL